MANRSKLHFLGIAGHTMSGLAIACQALGHEVTGTDEQAYPPGTDTLDGAGITWWDTSDPEHVAGAERVIISGHVSPDHPEVLAAQEQGIPVQSFPELVFELTKDARRIVVAGTHGKTTTISLITWILDVAGKNPDYLIGIKPHNFPHSVRLAGSPVAVIEGDEYRSSQLDTRSKFAYYQPDTLVITSIEMDHPDLFTSLDEIAKRFAELVASVPEEGRIWYWQGSQLAQTLADKARGSVESYGGDGAWQAANVRYLPEGLRFAVTHHGKAVADITVPLYGKHNVENVLAASAVTLGEGVRATGLKKALTSFRGASRRFERVSGESLSVTVLDDYAHHPTEVKTTIEAVKLHFKGRIVVMFKPHTFSRTEKLLKEYHQSFGDADVVYVADIEGARESSLAPTVSGADIAKGVGPSAHYQADRAKLLQNISTEARKGDTILCMSVNGYDQFAEELTTTLAKKFS